MGRDSTFEAVKAAVRTNPQALERAENMQQHAADNEVALESKPVKLGPKLQFDAAAESFSGQWADEANMFLSRNYREPFIVPNKF